jgi:hypothetical protein
MPSGNNQPFSSPNSYPASAPSGAFTVPTLPGTPLTYGYSYKAYFTTCDAVSKQFNSVTATQIGLCVAGGSTPYQKVIASSDASNYYFAVLHYNDAACTNGAYAESWYAAPRTYQGCSMDTSTGSVKYVGYGWMDHFPTASDFPSNSPASAPSGYNQPFSSPNSYPASAPNNQPTTVKPSSYPASAPSGSMPFTVPSLPGTPVTYGYAYQVSFTSCDAVSKQFVSVYSFQVNVCNAGVKVIASSDPNWYYAAFIHYSDAACTIGVYAEPTIQAPKTYQGCSMDTSTGSVKYVGYGWMDHFPTAADFPSSSPASAPSGYFPMPNSYPASAPNNNYQPSNYNQPASKPNNNPASAPSNYFPPSNYNPPASSPNNGGSFAVPSLPGSPLYQGYAYQAIYSSCDPTSKKLAGLYAMRVNSCAQSGNNQYQMIMLSHDFADQNKYYYTILHYSDPACQYGIFSEPVNSVQNGACIPDLSNPSSPKYMALGYLDHEPTSSEFPLSTAGYWER